MSINYYCALGFPSSYVAGFCSRDRLASYVEGVTLHVE